KKIKLEMSNKNKKSKTKNKQNPPSYISSSPKVIAADASPKQKTVGFAPINNVNVNINLQVG
ncbi:hypothetical protein HK096_004021, partial [Nowakowskiella sp. JEL0078]